MTEAPKDVLEQITQVSTSYAAHARVPDWYARENITWVKFLQRVVDAWTAERSERTGGGVEEFHTSYNRLLRIVCGEATVVDHAFMTRVLKAEKEFQG